MIGKTTMNESMYLLLKMVMFQVPASHFSFRGWSIHRKMSRESMEHPPSADQRAGVFAGVGDTRWTTWVLWTLATCWKKVETNRSVSHWKTIHLFLFLPFLVPSLLILLDGVSCRQIHSLVLFVVCWQAAPGLKKSFRIILNIKLGCLDKFLWSKIHTYTCSKTKSLPKTASCLHRIDLVASTRKSGLGQERMAGAAGTVFFVFVFFCRVFPLVFPFFHWNTWENHLKSPLGHPWPLFWVELCFKSQSYTRKELAGSSKRPSKMLGIIPKWSWNNSKSFK